MYLHMVLNIDYRGKFVQVRSKSFRKVVLGYSYRLCIAELIGSKRIHMGFDIGWRDILGQESKKYLHKVDFANRLH
jgi:hypothetical protein